VKDEMKTIEAGPYTLVARLNRGVFRGALWSSGKIIRQIEGDSLDDVWNKLQTFVANEFEHQVAARAGAEPTAKEACSAFLRIERKLSAGHKAMLRAHLRADGNNITATQLAVAAGYNGYSAANLQYGLLGAMLFAETPQVIPRRTDNSPIMTCVIARQGDQHMTGEGQWVWKMRTYIVEGLTAADIL